MLMPEDESTAARLLILEALTLATCPAEHETKFQNWVLRSSQSSVMRANAITIFADDIAAESTLDARLKTCEAWYAQHGKKPCFRISENEAAMAVDSALQTRSYGRFDDALVMQTSDFCSLNLTSTSAWQPMQIDVGDATQWRMLTRGEAPAVATREADAARRFGQSINANESANAYENAVQSWLHGVIVSGGSLAAISSTLLPRQSFACAIYDGAPVAHNLIASGVARTCGAHVGLFNIYTAPDYRGQGCGRAITQALLRFGQRQFATHAFLQVEAENVAAISLYAQLGFVPVYRYHYRRPL